MDAGRKYVKVTGLIWSDGEKINNGDTVVVEWSATLGDNYADRTFYAKEVDHMSLVSNTNVVKFVIELIKGNTSTAQYDNIFEDME